MIEGPDPASPWSRRLGRFWWQWGQPQHQHFVTCEAMVAVVEECGFDVVSVERGPATMSGELFNAGVLVFSGLVCRPLRTRPVSIPCASGPQTSVPIP